MPKFSDSKELRMKGRKLRKFVPNEYNLQRDKVKDSSLRVRSLENESSLSNTRNQNLDIKKGLQSDWQKRSEEFMKIPNFNMKLVFN